MLVTTTICLVSLVFVICAGNTHGQPRHIQQYLSKRLNHGPRDLYPEAAAALADTLELGWPEVPTNSPWATHPLAAGYYSWNSQYCVLDLSYDRSSLHRCCLLDSSGRPLWVKDIHLAQYPRVSDSGITALITVQRSGVGRATDTLQVEFVGPQGNSLGCWKSPRSDFFGAGRCSNQPVGLFHFTPRTDVLIALGYSSEAWQRGHRRGHRYIWAIDTRGRALWSHKLLEDPAYRMMFSGDGNTLLIYGHKVADSYTKEHKLYLNSIRVFDVDGNEIQRVLQEMPSVNVEAMAWKLLSTLTGIEGGALRP